MNLYSLYCLNPSLFKNQIWFMDAFLYSSYKLKQMDRQDLYWQPIMTMTTT